MRWIIAVILLGLAGPAAAGETHAEFAERVSQHIDAVRYDSIVSQASARGTPVDITVRFSVSATGKIERVRIVSSKMSAELNRYIVRAFDRLPPIRNVSMQAGKNFSVVLSLGG